jgi:hypothetical protein
VGGDYDVGGEGGESGVVLLEVAGELVAAEFLIGVGGEALVGVEEADVAGGLGVLEVRVGEDVVFEEAGEDGVDGDLVDEVVFDEIGRAEQGTEHGFVFGDGGRGLPLAWGLELV